MFDMAQAYSCALHRAYFRI